MKEAITNCYIHFGYTNINYVLYKRASEQSISWGVTLAQLVKASVGQSDVRRFEPHLGHNLLSCGVFLVKSRHFGLPLAQTIMAKLAISLSGWLGRYTNVEYLQSLYLSRGQNVGCPGSRRHSTFFTGTQHCILSSRQGTLLKMLGI